MLNVFAALVLSSASIGPTRPATLCVTDPVGDVVPEASEPMYDMSGVCVTVRPGAIQIEFSFVPPPSGSLDLSWFSGTVDFDFDRDTGTGRTAHCEEFLGLPLPLGVDYCVWVFGMGGGPGHGLAAVYSCTNDGEENLVQFYDAVIGTDTIRVEIPRAFSPSEEGLPIAGAFDFAVVAGNGGPTDIIPNAPDDTVPPRFAFPGDFDADGDVDLIDFESFRQCFNGSNRPPILETCAGMDFDTDNDVDLIDFAAFRSCFNGPNRPSPVACTHD